MSKRKKERTADFHETWENPDYIQWWLKKRAWKGPVREMQAEVVVQMIPYPLDRSIRVLDLCAGFGALAISIVKSRPNAKVFCIDGSEEMTRLGRDRTAAFGQRIEFAQAWLDTPDWLKLTTGTYNAIVSAQALVRFLSPERRKSLYKEIFNITAPGGCFINADDVCAPTKTLRKRYRRALNQWLDDYGQQSNGDRPAFVKFKEESPVNYADPRKDGYLDQELSSLREAGFEDVDCFWKFGMMTIYGGFRPEKPGLIESLLRAFKS